MFMGFEYLKVWAKCSGMHYACSTEMYSVMVGLRISGGSWSTVRTPEQTQKFGSAGLRTISNMITLPFRIGLQQQPLEVC